MPNSPYDLSHNPTQEEIEKHNRRSRSTGLLKKFEEIQTAVADLLLRIEQLEDEVRNHSHNTQVHRSGVMR